MTMQRAPADETTSAHRCLGDIVALSTLPAIWSGADPQRITESLAAALYTTLCPDLVYVSLAEGPDRQPTAVAQVGLDETSPALAARFGPVILEWARSRDPDELFCVPSPFRSGTLRVLARPIGLHAELGVIAVARDTESAPPPFREVVLNVAVTQATVAIHNALLMRSLRESEERLRLALHEREMLLERECGARAEAERANRMKDEFLAMISHELRTPLGAILGWTHLLRRSDATPAHRDRCLDVIERNTRLQEHLISDLLDVSRIVAGKLHLDLSSVDLPLVVEAAIDACRSAAECKQVKIDATIDATSMTLWGDAGRIQQVVTNLITNAIKFTPRGGSVAVSLARRGDRTEIVVRDTGQGIAPDLLPHVFERFRQGDAPSARCHGGLGLGLSIVEHLVALHGGAVRAESEGPGRGAKFTVTLPCAAD
jgi:signal transduction histidine kinase